MMLNTMMLKTSARPAGREPRQRRGLSRTRGVTTAGLARDRYFNVYCKLEPTGEKFQLKNISLEMKIKDLKSYTEFITGVPVNLQRLCYLDEGDLIEHTDVRHNDIVPGALLHMKVWNNWRTLVEAVVSGDIDWVFSLGVTANTDFRSPTSDYMAVQHPKIKQKWLEERAFVALYIASHRGNQRMCSKLVESGANVNARTPYGRSPLHVAAARGHGNIVDLLLEKGADIDAADNNGETPLTVAETFGNKVCERHLFLFRWQQRAKQTLKNKMQVDMFAHQYFDSTNPVWFKGKHGQIYLTQIGADIDAADNNGETPLTVAETFGNKVCERHLFLFRWQQRAKQTLKNKMQVDMFAHQYFDSTNPVWFKGKHGQIYLTQILPPGEFEGTSFNAPLRRSDTYTDEVNSDSDCESDGEIEMYQLDTKDTRTRTPIRRRTRQPDMMPAIKEETSSNNQNDNGGKNKGISNRRHRRVQSGKSFDEWLKQKQAVEQRKIKVQKEIELQKQVAIEERPESNPYSPDY